MDKSSEKISSAAKNYADALIQIGKEGLVSFDKLSSDLKDISDTLNASSELKNLLNNPAIREEVKIDILENIFDGKVDDHLAGFLKILVTKRRIGEYQGIYADFIARLNEIRNIQPVTVVSAVELNNDYKLKIIQKLNDKLGKKISPEWLIDEDIIAGITIKINDDVIDMSLKNRIERLNKSLMLK